MSNNIAKYYPIESRIHSLHPISKIICTLLFIVMNFLTFNLKFNILIGILLFITILNTNIPVKMYIKPVIGIKWLLLFILIINIIFKTDLIITVITLLRIIYIILYASVLIFTTTPNEITFGLQKLFYPLKLVGVPINRMALSISLALRFIPTIIEQGNRILKSQASRGIDYYNITFKEKIFLIKSLIISIFSSSINKADELALAMEIRLYDIDGKRTYFRKNNWQIYDTFLSLVHLLMLVLIVVKGV